MLKAELYTYKHPSAHYWLRYIGVLMADERVITTEYAYTLWGIKHKMRKEAKKYKRSYVADQQAWVKDMVFKEIM